MKGIKLALCLAGFAAAGTALAGPADYIFNPIVEKGEKEIELKFGSARGPEDDKVHVPALGVGYGVNNWWWTEIFGEYEKEGAAGFHLDSVELENKFQFTEIGKYPVDVGLITEIEVPRVNGDPWKYKWGPLFQGEIGSVQLNGNLLFNREFRDNQPHDTEMGYQFQVKYRLMPAFEFGVQAFGEMGKWNHWAPSDEQNHRWGPAVFGKLPLGNHQAFKYDAAFLVGASKAAPDHTFRMKAEYEFY